MSLGLIGFYGKKIHKKQSGDLLIMINVMETKFSLCLYALIRNLLIFTKAIKTGLKSYTYIVIQ